MPATAGLGVHIRGTAIFAPVAFRFFSARRKQICPQKRRFLPKIVTLAPKMPVCRAIFYAITFRLSGHSAARRRAAAA